MESRRRSGFHHGDLRNALERAALDLVGERGAHGFTLAEASRRAGVSVAAPFKHFASREALLAALAVRGYQEQERRFSAAVSSQEEPAQQLAEFAAAYVRFTVDERALFEITFGAGIDKSAYPELEEAGSRVLKVLAEAAGALRGDEDEAIALIYAVGAAAHGYAAFLHEGVFGKQAESVRRAERGAREAALVLAERLPLRRGETESARSSRPLSTEQCGATRNTPTSEES
ncbi:TetR/AcrR family transcriptional regulator [Streptomyces sp. NPDC048489]|uniref:TetR/AcrR family transcriptional regulator n=1 Tax=Streptomyces sp. NPDC048489 TaxID=3154504 RepID=UPI003440C179